MHASNNITYTLIRTLSILMYFILFIYCTYVCSACMPDHSVILIIIIQFIYSTIWYKMVWFLRQKVCLLRTH